MTFKKIHLITILFKNNKISLINRMKFKNFYLKLNNNIQKNHQKETLMIRNKLMFIDQFTVFNQQKILIKQID